MSAIWQARFARIWWSMGGPGHRAATLTSQKVTYQSDSPVERYACVADITAATARLTWTSDPRQGALDVVKHPTFMQQAMRSHPDYIGDCDDFAVYWAAALLKSKLVGVRDVFVGIAMWEGTAQLEGHACCVFYRDNAWWWVSNWFGCCPRKLATFDGFVAGMAEGARVPILVAGKYEVDALGGDDTVYLGRASPVRV